MRTDPATPSMLTSRIIIKDLNGGEQLVVHAGPSDLYNHFNIRNHDLTVVAISLWPFESDDSTSDRRVALSIF